MMRAARKELALSTEETTMIGDTMETDILGGVQLGFHTVLVLSGGARRDDLPRYAYRPEIVVESVAEYAEMLTANDGLPPWLKMGTNGTASRRTLNGARPLVGAKG
jgi:NagD protein